MFGILKEKKNYYRKKGAICDQLDYAGVVAYERLRSSILLSLADARNGRVIGITSSVQGEGKSLTAINLAYHLAKAEKKVLLIDGDLRASVTPLTLNLSAKPGLSNILVGMVEYSDCIQKVPFEEGWDYLATGDFPPNPSELLGSQALKDVIMQLRAQYDFILVDFPPLGIVSDAMDASSVLDGIITVVCQDYVTRPMLTYCMEQISRMPCKFLGYVMNSINEDMAYNM